MKLIIQNNRIAATASDEYDAPDCIQEPDGFDILNMDQYRMVDGKLVIPVLSEAERINALWQAAYAHEYAAISGSAIGLITIGVIQAMPKCLVVKNWINSIWAEYYVRKANGSVDYNFDVIGQCPHSVPELLAEVYP